MVDFFITTPQNLQASATRARSVAEGVTAASKKLDLSGISSGMPGSSSARFASHVLEAWTKELATISQDINGYAGALEGAANDYQSTDSQSSARLRQAGEKG